jgi:hypothetical protein
MNSEQRRAVTFLVTLPIPAGEVVRGYPAAMDSIKSAPAAQVSAGVCTPLYDDPTIWSMAMNGSDIIVEEPGQVSPGGTEAE